VAPYQAGNSGFINATNGKSGDVANQGAQETIKASTVKADNPTMSLPQMMELAMKNVKLTPLKCNMLLLESQVGVRSVILSFLLQLSYLSRTLTMARKMLFIEAYANKSIWKVIKCHCMYQGSLRFKSDIAKFKSEGSF
jgi:hypothetical protein